MEALSALMPLMLSAVEQFLPQIANASSPAIANIVKLVVAATPTVISEFSDLKPVLARIISGLKSNAPLTDDDLAALIAAEAQLDEDFDQAAADALAEDAAADAAAGNVTQK